MSRFQSVKPRRRPALISRTGRVACPVAGQAGTTPPAECPGPAPLFDLLAQLRGRPVTLLVDGHQLRGRVVSVHPLLLADGEGKATQVDPARIQSCQF